MAPAANEVESFLKRLGLSQYWDQLSDDGYDSMEIIELMEERDMVDLGIKKGHALLLSKRLRERANSGNPKVGLTCDSSKNRSVDTATRKSQLREESSTIESKRKKLAAVEAAEEAAISEKKRRKLLQSEIAAVEAELEDKEEESNDEQSEEARIAEEKSRRKALRRLTQEQEAKSAREEADRVAEKKRRKEAAATVAAKAAQIESSDDESNQPAVARKEKTKKTGDPDDAEEDAFKFRVFVACLPWTITEELLRKDFGECGTIKHVRLLTDKATGKPRGVAFVTYEDERGVQAALKYHGTEYGGRELKVQRAESRAETGARNAGGKGKGKASAGRGMN